MAARRMQLLKDAIPHTAQALVLLNPDGGSYQQLQWEQLELSAPSLGVKLQRLEVRQVSEFEDAFAKIGRQSSDVLFVINGSLTFVNRRLVVELATKHRLPTMTAMREYTEAGGLMSYGYVRADSFRRAAIYVAKILKGAKPADLPIELPTKYELVINLKTAKSLGLEIPHDLLLTADELIE